MGSINEKEIWEEFFETKVWGEKLLNITRTPRQTFLIDHTPQEFEEFWSQKMGAKSRKSFRYDQRALADQGEVEFECWETFEDVRAMMPATCLVEVESRKAKEGAGLYTVRGKRAFSSNYYPNWQKQEKCV